MPERNDKTLHQEDTEQVNEAVSFFEQILQSMPDDRVSLEVLSQAYEQAGDAAKACDLLSRLASVIERDGDVEAAKLLRQRLVVYAGHADIDAATEHLTRFLSSSATPLAVDDPKAAKAMPASGATVADSAALIASQAMQLISGPSERRAIVTQELDFAWLLHEQELLSEDQYASVVSDITDLSSSAKPLPVSVLHLFHDRHIPNIDRVLAFAAEKSGAPLLPLTSFEPQMAAYGLLPLNYMVIKGILPFEVMSRDLLVATLNPLNDKLREELEQLTGRRCHFYLVQPADFDTVIDKVRKLLQDAETTKRK